MEMTQLLNSRHVEREFVGTRACGLACMGTEGQTLPVGTLILLPVIDTIATKLKVQVGNFHSFVPISDKNE
jgi:hypothetical protein